MKKLIIVGMLLSAQMISFGQTDTTQNKKGYKDTEKMYEDKPEKEIGKQKPQPTDTLQKDCAITMINGKVMVTTDGKTVAMTNETRTANGNIVMVDGTVKLTDGNTFQMENGDCIDISGKMVPISESSVKGKRQRAN